MTIPSFNPLDYQYHCTVPRSVNHCRAMLETLRKVESDDSLRPDYWPKRLSIHFLYNPSNELGTFILKYRFLSSNSNQRDSESFYEGMLLALPNGETQISCIAKPIGKVGRGLLVLGGLILSIPLLFSPSEFYIGAAVGIATVLTVAITGGKNDIPSITARALFDLFTRGATSQFPHPYSSQAPFKTPDRLSNHLPLESPYDIITCLERLNTLPIGLGRELGLEITKWEHEFFYDAKDRWHVRLIAHIPRYFHNAFHIVARLESNHLGVTRIQLRTDWRYKTHQQWFLLLLGVATICQFGINTWSLFQHDLSITSWQSSNFSAIITLSLFLAWWAWKAQWHYRSRTLYQVVYLALMEKRKNTPRLAHLLQTTFDFSEADLQANQAGYLSHDQLYRFQYPAAENGQVISGMGVIRLHKQGQQYQLGVEQQIYLLTAAQYEQLHALQASMPRQVFTFFALSESKQVLSVAVAQLQAEDFFLEG